MDGKNLDSITSFSSYFSVLKLLLSPLLDIHIQPGVKGFHQYMDCPVSMFVFLYSCRWNTFILDRRDRKGSIQIWHWLWSHVESGWYRYTYMTSLKSKLQFLNYEQVKVIFRFDECAYYTNKINANLYFDLFRNNV